MNKSSSPQLLQGATKRTGVSSERLGEGSESGLRNQQERYIQANVTEAPEPDERFEERQTEAGIVLRIGSLFSQ